MINKHLAAISLTLHHSVCWRLLRCARFGFCHSTPPSHAASCDLFAKGFHIHIYSFGDKLCLHNTNFLLSHSSFALLWGISFAHRTCGQSEKQRTLFGSSATSAGDLVVLVLTLLCSTRINDGAAGIRCMCVCFDSMLAVLKRRWTIACAFRWMK